MDSYYEVINKVFINKQKVTDVCLKYIYENYAENRKWRVAFGKLIKSLLLH